MQELIAKMNETMAAIQADLNKEGNRQPANVPAVFHSKWNRF